MHGGCYLCSHRSTSQRKHREPQLHGKVIFINVDMGLRTFVFYQNDAKQEQLPVFCIYWHNFMLFHFLFPHSSVGE